MALDMFLDPDYAELIIEVNNLKNDIAEKIVEKEWLSTFIIPEIKHLYNLKLGKKEAELLLAKLNLEKLKRKISLFKEFEKYDNEIKEQEIDKIIDKEFKNKIKEYNFMQKEIQETINDTHKEKVSKEFIDRLNFLYKEMVLILSPLINNKNTILENELYDILLNSYKNADMNKVLAIKEFCKENNFKSTVEIDDIENMKKLNKKYKALLDESQSVVINIRSSEWFSIKSILENEILLRRRKDDINEHLDLIEKEYSNLLKKFGKMKK